jgi:hypothetical protein
LNSPGNPSVALFVAQWESIALRLRESGLPSVAPPTMQRLDMTANCNEHRAALLEQRQQLVPEAATDRRPACCYCSSLKPTDKSPLVNV